MVVSDDLDALKKIKFWATQAREPYRHYEHEEIGYNYRMSNIVAGIGRGQLKVLNERIKRKKKRFMKLISKPLQPFRRLNDADCVLWQSKLLADRNHS